jgi:MFS family permease
MMSNIQKIYFLVVLAFAFAESLFFVALVSIFGQSNSSTVKINALIGLLILSTFILEVISIKIINKFGFKKILNVACAFLLISLAIYIFSGSQVQLIMAEVFGGLGISFFSGAFEVFIFNLIKNLDRLHDFSLIYKKTNQYDQLGMVLGSCFGLNFIMVNPVLPWIIILVSLFVVVIMVTVINRKAQYKIN